MRTDKLQRKLDLGMPLLAAFFMTGCVLGVLMCLVQTPEMQSREYAQVGKHYFLEAYNGSVGADSSDYLVGLSRQTVLKSLRLDPDNAENWLLLSHILESQGEFVTSAQSRKIAHKIDPDVRQSFSPPKTFSVFQLKLSQKDTESRRF